MVANLGNLGTGTLTPEQVFGTAWQAGFPIDVATVMTAIAMKESGGNPSASNIRAAGTNGPSDPGEESYGLWQINVGPNGNKNLPAQMGIQKTDLYTPSVNAQAAKILWGGSRSNLDTGWYIDRAGVDHDRFMANLPRAQQAAQTVLAGSGLVPDTSDQIPYDDGKTSLYLAIGAGLTAIALVVLIDS